MAKITLLTHTGEPEKMIAAAAKLCYSAASVDDLLDGLDSEKASAFVEMLAEIGHESPIEHCSFTFAVEGVSRALLAQLTRHRIASYSVQSQRYVEEKTFSYVVPPEIEGSPEAMAVFRKAMEEAGEYYRQITDILRDKHQKNLTDAGEPEKAAGRKAVKMAIEDARFVLPNACETKLMVTMNARSLLNFFRHRCCNRAQWEIREVATEMLRMVRRVAPTLFASAGPPCVGGPCPEGKMSCGKMQAVRERFAHLDGLPGEEA